MGKGGGGTTTTTNSSAPPPQVLAQYQNVVNQANQVASQPLNQYSGQIVAGLTPLQNQGINATSGLGSVQTPYLNTAQNLVNQSTTPLWQQTQQFSPSAVNQYQSPYTQDVINSTLAEINQQDAGQQSSLAGNAASRGAWGGDRSAVAQALLANQQDLAKNQTIAGLNNQAYTQALGEFNQQQGAQLGAAQNTAALQAQGAFTEQGLGASALQGGLSAANAQIGAGGLQQQEAQANLNVPYEQFLQQQAYPFQTVGWLSGISTGLGSQQGGTSTTTQPQPQSLLSSIFNRGGMVGDSTGGAVWEPDSYDSGGNVSDIAPGESREMTSTPAYRLHSLGSEFWNPNNAGYSGLSPAAAPQPYADGGDTAAPGGEFDQMIAQNSQLPDHNPANDYPDAVSQMTGEAGLGAPVTAPGSQDGLGAKSTFMPAASSAPPDYQLPNVQRERAAPVNEVNPWESGALALAGLLAGRGYSRGDALANGILQGTQLGLQNYEGQKKESANEVYQQGNLDKAAEQLAQEAENHKDTIAQERAKMQQTGQYQEGELAARNRALDIQQMQAKQKELIKDPFTGLPTGLFNPTTNRIEPLAGSSNIGMMPSDNGASNSSASATSPASVPSATDDYLTPEQQNILSKYPPAAQPLIRGIIEGKINPTRQQLGGNPQMYIQAAESVDPSFDAVNYSARAKARGAFTSGAEAKQINALNTVYGHIGELADKADALNNFHESSWNPLVSTLNTAKNAYARGEGAPEIKGYDTAKKAVADELTRVWRQSGGNEADIQSKLKDLDSSNTPEQTKEVLGTMSDLIESKLDSFHDQYKNAMGIATDKPTFLSSKAAAIRDRIKGNSPQNPQSSTNVTAPAPSASDMVRVRNSNGQTGSIPKANLDAALKSGYQVVQ